MAEQEEPTNADLLVEIKKIQAEMARTKVELATALGAISQNIVELDQLLAKILTGAAIQVSTQEVEALKEKGRYGR